MDAANARLTLDYREQLMTRARIKGDPELTDGAPPGPRRAGEPCLSYQYVITSSMTIPDRDPGLDTLLDLHGETLFVDDAGH